MSTEYNLTQNLYASERSSQVSLFIDKGEDLEDTTWTGSMDAAELRKVIVKLVHVLSYISDDPNGALKRFNVDYGDTE